MVTLQIRDIDNRLYKTLKRYAQQKHRSLSQQLVRILEHNLPDSRHSAIDATKEFLQAERLMAGQEDGKPDHTRYPGTPENQSSA
jgi:hypothetical protein